MCLDNAGSVMQHNKVDFIDLLTKLYDECKNLSLIVTARCYNFGVLPNDCRPIFVKQLNNNEAV